MTSNKTIFTKNSAHLGDCIFCCVFFNKIKKYIEDNNIIFYFYCESDNYKQVIEFNTSKNVIIKTLSEIPNECCRLCLAAQLKCRPMICHV